MVVVSIEEPLQPRVVKRIDFRHPRAVAIQFRYGFVVDDEGLKVVDVTGRRKPIWFPARWFRWRSHDVYVARTYAYVANGREELRLLMLSSRSSLGWIRSSAETAS